MSKDKFCVWVWEIAVLKANGNGIAYWEVWQAFNTRAEAVEAQKRERLGGKLKLSQNFYRATQRMRKYVPAEAG